MGPVNLTTQEYDKPPEKELKKGTGMVNFCRTGGMMSECGLKKEKWKRQIDCKFAIKSANAERCQFETFEEFCWCTEAQDSANGLKGKTI